MYIPENEKCVIVLDNASYHSRKRFRIPTMSTKKDEMLKFMEDHNIEIPYPVPFKSVLLMKIKEANIRTKFVVDELAAERGLEILRLPPYHCVLNPIELVWARLKSDVRKCNVTPSLSASVCESLRKCAENISSDTWAACVGHVIKKEDEYFNRDLHHEDEGFVIHLGESGDEDN